MDKLNPPSKIIPKTMGLLSFLYFFDERFRSRRWWIFVCSPSRITFLEKLQKHCTQKKIQNEWFDVAMIESGSLTLDPNDDPSTPVFVAFVKRNLLADTTQIKYLMLESITDFDINGTFAPDISALFDDEIAIKNGIFPLFNNTHILEEDSTRDFLITASNFTCDRDRW